MSEKTSKTLVKIGSSSFRELRESGCFYADKTDLIEEFLDNVTQKACLITRPIGFGKSLNMSMLAEFFDIAKDSRDLFAGLKISAQSELCAEWMNQWPVLFVSLKDVQGASFSQAFSKFAKLAGELCSARAFLMASEKVNLRCRKRLAAISEGTANEYEVGTVLSVLCDALSQHYSKKVVVLIDDYDAPLAKAQQAGFYQEMYEFLHSLFSKLLKGNSSLKFGITTGCLRVFNECYDCYNSSNVVFADKFGFTSKDADKLLSAAGLSDRKAVLEEWYKGYCFGREQTMYCPGDVLCCIRDLQRDPKAQPAAYLGGTSAFDDAMRLAQHAGRNISGSLHALLRGGTIAARINESLSCGAVQDTWDNLWTFLYLTGCLTKADEKRLYAGLPDDFQMADDAGLTALRIPNKAVRTLFQDSIALWDSPRI